MCDLYHCFVFPYIVSCVRICKRETEIFKNANKKLNLKRWIETFVSFDFRQNVSAKLRKRLIYIRVILKIGKTTTPMQKLFMYTSTYFHLLNKITDTPAAGWSWSPPTFNKTLQMNQTKPFAMFSIWKKEKSSFVMKIGWFRFFFWFVPRSQLLLIDIFLCSFSPYPIELEKQATKQ